MSFCAQDILDPILVRALGQAELAELRFGTEVSGLRSDPAGVTAELTDRRDGTRRVVRADYLIAADYVPTARPGHRAPHYPLSCDGGRRSTIDLFDGKLIALSPRKRWCDAARAAGAALGVPLSAHVIADPAWAARYGVGPDGAVLVRPDGYVAWRRTESCDDMPGELHRAIDTVLCRT